MDISMEELEQRVPYMDHEVVEFAFSLPTHYKLQIWKEKRILKDMASGLVPLRIQKRPKQGFNVPINLWFRQSLKVELIKLLNAKSIARMNL